jgi:hypothetical protein
LAPGGGGATDSTPAIWNVPRIANWISSGAFPALSITDVSMISTGRMK